MLHFLRSKFLEFGGNRGLEFREGVARYASGMDSGALASRSGPFETSYPGPPVAWLGLYLDKQVDIGASDPDSTCVARINNKRIRWGGAFSDNDRVESALSVSRCKGIVVIVQPRKDPEQQRGGSVEFAPSGAMVTTQNGKVVIASFLQSYQGPTDCPEMRRRTESFGDRTCAANFPPAYSL